MGKKEKLITRFKAAQHGFKWSELLALLKSLGFEVVEGDGSRVGFVRDNVIIRLHKPHPQKEIKVYAMRQVRELLEKEGLL